VLTGPEESTAQGARRISNLSRDASGRATPLVLVHVGGVMTTLDNQIIALSQQNEDKLRFVQVRANGQGGEVVNPPDDADVAFLTMDEDAVFSSSFRLEVEAFPDAWVVVSVAGSDQAIVRACAVVNSAILVVREGERTETLERVTRALRHSPTTADAVVGVVIIGTQTRRDVRAHRAAAPAAGAGRA
jgi:hypothetical protein